MTDAEPRPDSPERSGLRGTSGVRGTVGVSATSGRSGLPGLSGRRRALRVTTAVLAAGVLLLVGALLLTLRVPDADLPAFLAMILGGWCVGIAFVQATGLLRRGGLALLAIGAGAAGATVLLTNGALRAGGPGTQAVAYVLAMASLPAAGWIALSLLGRLLDLARRATTRAADARRPPEWDADDPRGGAVVRVRAVPWTMRRLTLALIATVAVAGTGGAGLMIALAPLAPALGARLLIVILGLVLALPVYLIFRAVLGRRAAAYVIGFGPAELRLDGPGGTERFRYDAIERLVWRTDSDYARVEVHAGTVHRTLLVGQAPSEPGRTAELPPLSRRALRALAGAGLTPVPSRRDTVRKFVREARGIPKSIPVRDRTK